MSIAQTRNHPYRTILSTETERGALSCRELLARYFAAYESAVCWGLRELLAPHGYSSGNIRSSLLRLVAEGVIVRTRRGCYQRAEAHGGQP